MMIAQHSRKRFLRDEMAVRLGNLASSLSRLSTLSQRPIQDKTTQALIRECARFIEWTGPEAPPDLQEYLVDLQVDLARCHLRWARGVDEAARQTLKRRAKEASDRVLQDSGLLK
jgi:hypothetical protein